MNNNNNNNIYCNNDNNSSNESINGVDNNNSNGNNNNINRSFVSIDLSQPTTTNIIAKSQSLIPLSSPLSILTIEEEMEQSDYFSSKIEVIDQNIRHDSIDDNNNGDNNKFSLKPQEATILFNSTTIASAIIKSTVCNNTTTYVTNGVNNNIITITKPPSVKHRYHKVPIQVKTSLISNFYDFPLGTYNTISSLTDYIMMNERQYQKTINIGNVNVNQKTKRRNNLFGGLKSKLIRRKNGSKSNLITSQKLSNDDIFRRNSI